MPVSTEEPRELLKTVVKYDQSNSYGPFDQIVPKGRLKIRNDDGSLSAVLPVIGYANITDLLDVHVISPADGDVFQYSASAGGWVNHGYVDLRAISAPSNPSTAYGRVYVKTIDSNNEGLFIKVKRNGSFQEVRLL